MGWRQVNREEKRGEEEWKMLKMGWRQVNREEKRGEEEGKWVRSRLARNRGR